MNTHRHALVTGAAGFIGSHLVDRLLADGWSVTGVDNFDTFYSQEIKRRNIAGHLLHPHYRLLEVDVRDLGDVSAVDCKIDVIVHLAAKAGVRPSLENPTAYQDTNVGGTQRVLDFARRLGVTQFVFASSSSVYGVNPDVPWREEDCVLRPISPYASSKVSAELLGHVYSHLYGIRFLALRFFTVYGPRQRPDLAIHKFCVRIRAGEGIQVFGNGSTRRDYTYIDDIVDGLVRAMSYDRTSFEIVNLGNNRTVSLAELIAVIESSTGRTAVLERMAEQPGDVPQTWADISKAQSLFGYSPRTALADGIAQFIAWLGSR